jgi:hypothetical protein
MAAIPGRAPEADRNGTGTRLTGADQDTCTAGNARLQHAVAAQLDKGQVPALHSEMENLRISLRRT